MDRAQQMEFELVSPDGMRLGAITSLDFSLLRREKCSLYMPHTRIWLFEEIDASLNNPDAAKLLWVMGGAGTGKSVVSAMLLERPGAERFAAHHFCLHTKPAESQPLVILASLAAQLHANLAGFAAKFVSVSPPDVLKNAIGGELDIETAFKVLLCAPLKACGCCTAVCVCVFGVAGLQWGCLQVCVCAHPDQAC